MLMIDVHTHVFNAAYLPLRGIFLSRGLRDPAAGLLARLLNEAVLRDGALPRGRSALLGRSPLRAAGPGVDLDAGWDALVAAGVDPATTYAREVDAGFLESHEADIDRALAAMSAQAATDESRLNAFTISAAADQAVDAELELLSAGGIRRRLRRLLLRAAELMDDGRRLIGWVLLLLARESTIAERLAETYSGTDLFVHHMMDMDRHYPRGKSLYPFNDLQLRRMRALVERSAGTLLTFVAYSPFRKDGVELVERWLGRGCAGVKFYPPNGYRPIGNTAADLEGTGQDPAEVDARNLRLFRLCAERGIPIFSHCQPGEMEANPRRRTGCLSNPAGWMKVLATPGLERLRLCLGHAGGEGWLAPAGDEDREGRERCKGAELGFVSGAVEVAMQHDNVYLEFGCLETIFEPGPRQRFAERFAGYARRYGDKFIRRVLYGSDWHMLARAPDPGGYDDQFRNAFREHPDLAGLPELEHRFFFRNALEYLNLPGYLERSAGHITQAEQSHLRMLLEKA